MKERFNLGSIGLGRILKVCIALTVILVLIGVSVGATRVWQVKQERNDILGINKSLQSQGVSDTGKNLISSFIKKYPQTKNIIVTDKDDNIVYSANSEYLGGAAKFVLEVDNERPGVLGLKDTTIKFFASPGVAKMIDRTSDSNSSNYNFQTGRNGMGPMGMLQNGHERFRPMDDRRGQQAGMMKNKGERRFGKAPFMMGYHKTAMFEKDQSMLFLNANKINDNMDVYYLSSAFRENSMSKILVVTGMLLKLLGLVFWILIALWVYKDSKLRGLNPIFWGILSIIAGPLGLIIYLIYRHYSVFCSQCGTKAEKDSNFCGVCGAPIKVTCSSCGQLISVDKNYCKNCGTKQIKE